MKKRKARLDYAFWDSRRELTENQVVHLWCGLEPEIDRGHYGKLRAIREQLLQAKMDGLVRWRLEHIQLSGSETDYEVWYRRQDLVDYAELVGEHPAFLFPAYRCGAGRQPDPQTQSATTTVADIARSVREAVPGIPDQGGANTALYPSGLLTVKQFCEKYPEFTPGSMRYHIWRARPQQEQKTGTDLPENGLAIAIRRRGRTVRIDEKLFMVWWQSQDSDQQTTPTTQLQASRALPAAPRKK